MNEQPLHRGQAAAAGPRFRDAGDPCTPVNSSASGHITDDELIRRLHGLGSVAEHLEACSDCRARWTRFQERHAALSAVPQLSEGFFTAQRRRILERIYQAQNPGRNQNASLWAPLRSIRVPAALAVLLAAGLVYHHVRVVPPPAPAAPSPSSPVEVEAEWFEHATSHLGTVEPRAASPIRELFAEESAE